jgi:hypothetical protein
VGEGFERDGSTGPGGRVYMTQDGETFNEVHRENTTGMESLMTARMISTTEHWAGGTTKAGALLAPALGLHSTDGGATHINEAESIQGNMFTSWDFLSSEHGYATALTAAQVCNILEFGGSNPPAPSPTPGSGNHYAKPPCQADEAMARVTGTDGVCCAPACQDNACPTDTLDGVTAQPACALSDQSGNKFCTLLCESDDQCDNDNGASCVTPTPGQPGLCLYSTTANNGIPMFMQPSVLV